MANNVPQRYVFIVDDEPIQNEMLKDFLTERYLYTINVYENGEAALKDMHLRPEIVVLDYHLSGSNRDAMDGVQVLKAIKETNPETQVIMLSGQDKIEVAIDTMKYGAFDYVVKGESAFSRVENIINNASEIHKLKVINASQKKAITFLVAVISLIFLGSIYMFLVKPYLQ
ncbi:MAG: response regulator [Taibaiella sp.]|nr:response regulator [Taibaiella sp.]